MRNEQAGLCLKQILRSQHYKGFPQAVAEQISPEFKRWLFSTSELELHRELYKRIRNGKDRWLGLREVCENLSLVRRLLEVTSPFDVRYGAIKPIEECLENALKKYQKKQVIQ